MSPSIKTDARLLARLSASIGNPMTPEKARSQRISFIYGALPHNSPITRDQIAASLDAWGGL